MNVFRPDFQKSGKRICLIGGKLQGVEAAYLSQKAGLHVILIDKNKDALAREFADEFHCFDVTADKKRFVEISQNADFMLPVNENQKTIDFLEAVQSEISPSCALLFDFGAYRISCDKNKSKNYFRSVNVPTPADRPTEPPFFIKPPNESGSTNARIVRTEKELESVPAGYLIEEYVEGPVWSLEVIGDGKHYNVVKETHIHLDDVYDCNQVTPLPESSDLRKITLDLAKGLNLKGIMDVEAIKGQKGFKVLEIDARFPSQTPICVYFSSGVNLISLLIEAFGKNYGVGSLKKASCDKYVGQYCILEHFIYEETNVAPVYGKLTSGGEHLVSKGKKLTPIFVSENIEIYEFADQKYRAYTIISHSGSQEEAEKYHEAAKLMVLEKNT
ncbi:3-methylornithine--L-lysine ligase PylC [Methanolapillus africanus]|uniref:3-methylornithine--L-lysine ligase PylC n=1 Tax=Methanolapillus africanus TaxID=3028297 RepID=UPI0030B8C010